MKFAYSISKLYSDMSIRRKLIVTNFIIAFIPILIVIFVSYSIVSSAIKQTVSSYVYELLKIVNDNIDTSLDELYRISSAVCSDEILINTLAKDINKPPFEQQYETGYIYSKLSSLAYSRPSIEGIYIFSYSGEIYQYTSNTIYPKNYNFKYSQWFKLVDDSANSTILIPTHKQDEVLNPSKAKDVFSIVQEIYDINSKKPIGYMLMNINTGIFQKIWLRLNINKYDSFIIIDSNNTIVYHSNENFISYKFKSSYLTEITKNKNGYLITDIDGKYMLVTYNTSTSTNWTVISQIPVSTLFIKIVSLQYLLITIPIIFLIISFGVSILISRDISKPIVRLQKLMKKTESGDFDVSIPVTSKDEIGELSSRFNNMVVKIKSLIQTVYKTEILKKEAELNALQSQINPHFLFNTLQIVDFLTDKEDTKSISLICQSLAKIFRYSINTGKEIVPLSYEIEHISNYILIQKIRFANRVDIMFDIDDKFYNYKMIKLVLQPLVENSIFHGLEGKKGQCFIKVSAREMGNDLYIAIEDNGKGISDAQLSSLQESLNDEIVHAEIDGLVQKSIGVKNVNARIKLYFGKDYGITVESKLNIGTKVIIKIPSITFDNKEEIENA